MKNKNAAMRKDERDRKMRYVRPHYYDEFKCIADKCPDTCCAGWQIAIDDDTLYKYEAYAFGVDEERQNPGAQEPDFALRMRNSIDWAEGCFLQKNHRCAMLNDQNLCDLIQAKGEEWLCDTCNRYPRHVEEFDGLREYSLSLSCPVAAEIMLKRADKTTFIVKEDDAPDPLEEEFEDFDFMLFTQLEDARGVMFTILQNREISIAGRMALLMEMAVKMQECIDEERLFDLQGVVEDYAGKKKARKPIATGEKRFEKLKEGFVIYTKLERLREDWTQVLEGTKRELYEKGYRHYQDIYEEFGRCFVAKFGAGKDDITPAREFTKEDETSRWEVFLEQISTFFLYTYFCGAVYDECIYSKVAMAVMSACYIQEFILYTWYAQGKQLTFEDCVRVAYRYAREIEHSDLNLNDLEQWLMDRM